MWIRPGVVGWPVTCIRAGLFAGGHRWHCHSAGSKPGWRFVRVNKVLEGRPHIVDMIKNDEADLIINTTEGRRAIEDSAPIRASAEAHRVFYTTTLTAQKPSAWR